MGEKIFIDRKEKNTKVILDGFDAKIFTGFADELKKRDIDIIYWIGGKKPFNEFSKDKIKYPATIFHPLHDVVLGISAPGVDTTSFPPVGKGLVDSLLGCEAKALSMMNLFDTESTVPLIQKKHTYYTALKYWQGIFKATKPDAIFFDDIPHKPHNTIMYHLAKKEGIRTLMFKRTQIDNKVLFFDDIQDYKNLRIEYDRINKNGDANLSDLSINSQKYYKRYCVDAHADKTLPYMQKEIFEGRFRSYYKGFPSARSIVRVLKMGTLPSAIKTYAQMYFGKKRSPVLEKAKHRGFYLKWRECKNNKTKAAFKKKYERLQKKIDFSNKFVYVPLHYQPECSTSGMGDIFTDQILMIDLVRAVLPKGWFIYVKENPLQWKDPLGAMGRFSGYYQEIADMKNVYLIPAETSTFDLIKNSQAVATVTGSAGWEALLFDKPAFLFGYTWYMHCDGVFGVTNVSECKYAMEKIAEGYKPNKQKILNYIAAVDTIGVPGFHSALFKKAYAVAYNLIISNEENTKNIAEGFSKELQKN